jgi:hypothetical protein
MVLDNPSNMSSEFLRLWARISLSVNANNIFSTRRTSKGAALDVVATIRIDLFLSPFWRVELAFSVGSLEQGAIENFNFQKTIWQVDVRVLPLLWAPTLVSQDDFGEEHVRQSVTDSLVDEVNAGLEGIEGILLAWRLWLRLSDELDGWVGEEHSAVAIRFKVHTDIEALGSVVEVLDASRRANYRKFEHLLYIFGGSAVSVCSLNKTDPQLFAETCISSHFSKKNSAKRRNAITIEQMKHFIVIEVVVDNTVSIAVKRAAAVQWGSVRAWWGPLFGLDVVGTTLNISVSARQASS